MNKLLTVVLIVFAGLTVLAISVIGVLVGTYNGLVTKEQACNSSWSQVQNVYKRRADLVPQLVSTVKGAAHFEKSTFTEVAKARASVGQVKLEVKPGQVPTADEQRAFLQAQESLGGALQKLMMVQERYPELKANQNFQELQAQLEGTENRISVERKNFTDAVEDYDSALLRFPTNLLNRWWGFKAKPYFGGTEIDTGEAPKNAPTVSFE